MRVVRCPTLRSIMRTKAETEKMKLTEQRIKDKDLKTRQTRTAQLCRPKTRQTYGSPIMSTVPIMSNIIKLTILIMSIVLTLTNMSLFTTYDEKNNKILLIDLIHLPTWKTHNISNMSAIPNIMSHCNYDNLSHCNYDNLSHYNYDNLSY